MEGRPQTVPFYEPEQLPALLVELGLPAEGAANDLLAAGNEDRDEQDPNPTPPRRGTEKRAYEARRQRLEELLTQTPPGAMTPHQRRAYEVPTPG